MTCTNIILAQPQAQTSVDYKVPEGESIRFSFDTQAVSNISISDNGALVISFNDGGELTLTNFQEITDNGSLLYFSDGTLMDPAAMGALDNIETAAGTGEELQTGLENGVTHITHPFDNVVIDTTLESGQKYVLDFEITDPQNAYIENGDLVLTFANQGVVVLRNFQETMDGELPPELSIGSSHTIISGDDLITDIQLAVQSPTEQIVLELEEDSIQNQDNNLHASQAEEVTGVQPPSELELAQADDVAARQAANVEPASGSDESNIAQQLANIAPAAGDTVASSRVGNSGYGFNSHPGSDNFDAEQAVGAIGETELIYNVEHPIYETGGLPQTPAAPVDDIPEIMSSTTNTGTTDETDMDEGSSVNGQIVVDFGNDGPGTITPNGYFEAGGSLAGGNLTSGGTPVIVTQTDDGYVGTANGETIFTLELDPETGEYVFNLYGPLDHADGNDPDDVITLDFGIVATDSDGDTAVTNISIDIQDDAPLATPDIHETLDEADGSTLVASGTLDIDFGTDGAGQVSSNGNFEASGSLANGNLTHNGVPVVVTQTADGGYIGMAGDVTIFTLEIDPNTGDYSFTLLEGLDHGDPDNPNDVITLDFGVSTTDADSDSTQSHIVIDIVDAAPVIGDSFGDVDESNLDDGSMSYSGTIDADFGNDIASIEPGGEFTVFANGSPIALTSGGIPVTITQTANGYVGTAGGETIFTLTIDPATGNYTYTQNAPLDHPDGSDANDIVSLEFSVDIIGADGDHDSGTITINVADDAPAATDDINGAEEGQLITGDVTGNDDMGNDDGGSVTQVTFEGTEYTIPAGGEVTIEGNYGTLTIHSDGTYSYQATDEGDPDGTDHFTYVLTDGDGDSVTASLDIRVTPDGEPVAVDESVAVDETNVTPGPMIYNDTMDVDFGLDGAGTITGNGEFSAGGSLAGGNLTSNGIPVVITQTPTGYVGTAGGETIFTLDMQNNGDYSFQMFGHLDHADSTDPNDVINLTFGVTISDSDGDTADGTIRIDIHDDAPVAYDDNIAMAEGERSETGSVTTNDALSEDNPNDVISIEFEGTRIDVPETGSVSIDGNYGTLTISADGSYTYTLFDNVESGGTASLNPNSDDVAGDSDTLTKNGITITGSNSSDNDLTWVRTSAGEGIGLAGGNDKIWPKGETLEISFDKNVETATITVADIGSNNVDDGIDFLIYLSNDPDNPISGEIGFENYTIVDGMVTFNINLNDYVSDLPDGVGIARIDISSTDSGQYDGASFLLNNIEVDYVDTVSDTFTYSLQDSDGDIDTAELTLTATNVHDDNPEICSSTSTVNESGGDVIAVSGTLPHDFGDDGAGSITGNGDFRMVDADSGNILNLTSGGDHVTVTQTANGYIGIAAGVTVFTLTIDPATGEYNYNQFAPIDHPDASDPDDEILLNFGVTISDSDGDTDTASIIIRVSDDAPVAHNDHNSFIYSPDDRSVDGNVITGENGGDNAADNEGMDGATVTSVSYCGHDYDVPETGSVTIDGHYGTLTISADGSYTYDIYYWAKNYNDVSDEFTYTLTDGDGDTDVATLCLSGHNPWDPLVVDIDGDGIELTNLYDGNVMFDINNDGQTEHTAWVASDDGLLAIDANHDGIINDASELFGNQTEDGFSVLASYDSNGDLMITASDDMFSSIVIWQDVNQDGISQADEILSLGDLGIMGISLNTSDAGYILEGNLVSETSTITYEDGTTGEIADVWFRSEDNADNIPADEAGLFNIEQSDEFLFQAISEGVDTIVAFGQSDDMDISQVLESHDPLTDAINDFVYSTTGGETTGTAATPQTDTADIADTMGMVTLDSVSDINIGEMVNDGNLIS